MQLLTGSGAPRAVDQHQEIRTRTDPVEWIGGVRVGSFGRSHHGASQRRSGGEPREADLAGVEPPLACPRTHQLHGAVSVQNPGVLSILRGKPVGEHEGRGAPVVESLGDLESFGPIHHHDISAAGRDDHRSAIGLSLRRKKHGEKRRIERPGPGCQRDLTFLPQGDVVGNRGF